MPECTLTRTEGNWNVSNKEMEKKIVTVLRDLQAHGVGEELGCKIWFILGSSTQPAEDQDAKGGSYVLWSGTASLGRKALPKSLPAGVRGSLQKPQPQEGDWRGKPGAPASPPTMRCHSLSSRPALQLWYRIWGVFVYMPHFLNQCLKTIYVKEKLSLISKNVWG